MILATLKEYSRITKAWEGLGQDIYVVWYKTPNGGRIIFVEDHSFGYEEGTDEIIGEAFDSLLRERAGRDEPEPEVVIRVFTSEEDAGFYMETVGGFLNFDPPQIEVTKMKLHELYECRDLLLEQAKRAKAGLRIDVSSARIEQFVPDSIDTIWSSQIEPH